MRIISKFRDYYDCLSTKDDLIFVRKETSEKIQNKDLNYTVLVSHIKLKKTSTYIRQDVTLIGLCGEFYIHYPIETIITSKDQKINFNLLLFDDYITEKSKQIRKTKTFDSYKYGLGRHINDLNKIRDYFSDYFLKHNTSYFKVNTHGKYSRFNHDLGFLLTSNFNNLIEFDFQKLYRTEIMFQKIEQYLSNVIIPNQQKDLVEITDNKVLLESKGFDNKTSFRHPIK